MTIYDQVRQDELKRMKEEETLLPSIDLSEDHIKNLRILINREALIHVMPKNSVVAEIGVARGDFSEKILSITRPKELHLIDSWAHDRYSGMKEIVENRFRQKIEQGQVHIHQGLSTVELEKFGKGYFDWVYLDTNHDYETTAEELVICQKKVNEGGIVSGHDYIKGNWIDKIRYGVIEAVNEFCVINNWEMIYLTNEVHRYLSFAIKKISKSS